MKKNLIALAVLSAAGVASAQSSVTLYGVADFGTKTSRTKVTVTNDAGEKTSTTTSNTNLFGNEGQNADNRIGLKGTEDLGGGLKLGFNYELGINADATAAGSFAGTTRRANLSLDSGFGTVTIGTFMNNIDTVRDIQPTNTVLTKGLYAGDNLSVLDKDSNLSDLPVGRIDGRSVNSLGYKFAAGPIWAGVDMGHTTKKAPNKDKGGSDTQKWTTYTLGAGYDDDTLKAGVALGIGKTQDFNTPVGGLSRSNSHDTIYEKNRTTGKDARDADGKKIVKEEAAVKEGKMYNLVLGASYKIGMFTPYAAYEQSKLTGADENGLTSAVGSDWIKNRTLALGTAVDLGATTVWGGAAYGKTTMKDWTGSMKTTGFELGATYSLSKRTSLYGFYNYAQHKSTTPGTVASKKERSSALTAGLTHKF